MDVAGGVSAKATNNNLQVVESGGSLDLMISSTLSPNSSKVPLIESKEALNEQEDEFKRGRLRADEELAAAKRPRRSQCSSRSCKS